MVIALVSFGSMVVGAALGLQGGSGVTGLTWAYGLAAGAMLASAAAFLLPVAIARDPQLGGFGIAAGVLAGFALHTLGEKFGGYAATSTDDVVVRLTIHAVTAGLVIGAIYTSLPGVGLLLGLSIVSHKGQAGYAAAQQLHQAGRSALPLVVPAAGIGIPAVAVGLLGVTPPEQLNAVIFGFAAGVFLHLAVDFLPTGGESTGTEVPEKQIAVHASVSAVLGASAVVLAWLVISTL